MKLNKLLQLLFTITCITFFSCSNKTESTTTDGGLLIQYIDSTVNPGDDFFMFANGKWYDTATIAPAESRAGARLEMDFITKTT